MWTLADLWGLRNHHFTIEGRSTINACNNLADQKNMLLSNQRQSGVKSASGSYFCFEDGSSTGSILLIYTDQFGQSVKGRYFYL